MIYICRSIEKLMSIRRIIFFFTLLFCITSSLSSQGYNIGIRAGIGQSKFNGALEEGENFGFAGGFHFGINFQWNFNDFIGVRSEVLYNQTGSSYTLDTEQGYYLFEPAGENDGNILIRDESLITLDHSNAYIQLPQTIHVSIVPDKLEIFGGGYIGFLVSPVATGNILFGGESAEKEHSFRQGLNFNYFSDDADKRFDTFNGPSPFNNILIRANGVDVDLREFENSYDLFGFNIEESRFLSIDYGLIAGASYYLNRGLYIMGRVEYGLRDITRNTVDYSFTEVNDNQTPVFKEDVDRNFGVYLSLGFRF